jgi:hypothetical protein
MVNEPDLARIEERLRSIGDVAFFAHAGTVVVRTRDGTATMLVRRDLDLANVADTEFVSHSISDVRRLMDSITSGMDLGQDVKQEIAARVEGASPGPWRAYIESDGGQGGCDFIQVSDSDDEADMYLWIDGDLAPMAYFRFVADARQDIPALLEALGKRR